MSTNCKNCDNIFEGNFCNNCGQTAHTHKINWHFVWHDIQHGIFHVDSGIFYTIKELFLRPGTTVRNFIEGKRVAYFKPVAMVFLLATLYGILYHYFHIRIPSLTKNEEVGKIDTMINEWVTNHYALASLLFIPLYSAASYLSFRKSGYNYVEHGVINLYLGAAKLVTSFILFPFLYLYNNTPFIWQILGYMMLIDTLFTVYFYYDIFINYGKFARVVRTLLSIIYFFLTLIILSAIAGFIIKMYS